jgi:hypothetical protein
MTGDVILTVLDKKEPLMVTGVTPTEPVCHRETKVLALLSHAGCNTIPASAGCVNNSIGSFVTATKIFASISIKS